MPADTKASSYSWYISDEPEDRIVMFEWQPEGEFVSSMTFGQLVLKKRETVDDDWEVAVEVGGMSWVVAQNLVRDQGFNVEVANA